MDFTEPYEGAPYPPVDGSESCRQDPEAFFPEVNGARATARARGFCETCHVRKECLDYALTHAVAGIWGGTTAYQRRQIIRKHHIRVVPLTEAVTNRAMIIRAHRRGMSNTVVAKIAEVDLAVVENVLRTWRIQERRQQHEVSA